MPNVTDCPGFEPLGSDLKIARKALGLSRQALADMVYIDSRYLADIENYGKIPSVPVLMQLIRICKLPAERYFNPGLLRGETEQRQRISHKLELCPDKYLPVVEGALDGAFRAAEAEDA